MPALHRRAWLVKRQLDRRGCALKFPMPIVELTLERFGLQPVPLPSCIVGILNGQRAKRRTATAQNGLINFPQFVEKDLNRAFVADDPMSVE